MADDVIDRLAQTIADRRAETAEKSYTRTLLDGGREKCARKFGEEALETVIAGVTGDREALIAEAADTVYHLLVLLEVSDARWSDVTAQLARRTSLSGHDEKAARAKSQG